MLDVARSICEFVALDISTHEQAFSIAENQSYNIYAALIIAVALQAGCIWLYSEDMQHDQLIDNQLRIHNPFLLPNLS